jgi:hypothetical protein
MIKTHVGVGLCLFFGAYGSYGQSVEAMKFSWSKITTPVIDFWMPTHEKEKKAGGLGEYEGCFAENKIDSSWFYQDKGINLIADLCISWGKVDPDKARGVIERNLDATNKFLMADSLFTPTVSRLNKSNGAITYMIVYAGTPRARKDRFMRELQR